MILQEPQEMAGCTILSRKKFRNKVNLPWKYSVIVKLFGRTIGFRALQSRIEALWKPKGRWKVIDLENNYYMIQMGNEEDYVHALTGGPWVIFDHYLAVEPWSTSFDPAKHETSTIMAWIRLPGLPIQWYHKKVLRAIGQAIGDVIKIDYKTRDAKRGRFARIAVKLDTSKPLLPMVVIEGREQIIEYEHLPLISFVCWENRT